MKNKLASAIMVAALSIGTSFALPSGTADVTVTTNSNGDKVVTGTITTQTTTGGVTTTTTTTDTKTYANGDLDSTPDVLVEALIAESTPNGDGTYTVKTTPVVNGTAGTPTTDTNVSTPPPTVPGTTTDLSVPPGDPVVSQS